MSGATSPEKSQRGSILMLVLLFLLPIALIALSVMQSSVLEYRVAANAQSRERAFQYAEAIVSAIVVNEDNFPIDGSVGDTLCGPEHDSDSCDPLRLINLPGALLSAIEDMHANYSVRRMAPLLSSRPHRRLRQDDSDSHRQFRAAIFEVSAVVVDERVGYGTTELVRGVGVRVPQSNQGQWESP